MHIVYHKPLLGLVALKLGGSSTLEPQGILDSKNHYLPQAPNLGIRREEDYGKSKEIKLIQTTLINEHIERACFEKN